MIYVSHKNTVDLLHASTLDVVHKDSEDLDITADNSQLIYTFTLTGDPDIEIPISSFQGNLRSGANTYLSVVIPGLDQAFEISNRATGQMVIKAKFFVRGIFRQQVEIARVNLSSIRIDKGPFSKSITLTGYRQETYAPKTIELTDPTYMVLNAGNSRFRFARPDLTLAPGDTVIVGDYTITANVISYYVAVSNGYAETRMEVSDS